MPVVTGFVGENRFSPVAGGSVETGRVGIFFYARGREQSSAKLVTVGRYFTAKPAK